FIAPDGFRPLSRATAARFQPWIPRRSNAVRIGLEAIQLFDQLTSDFPTSLDHVLERESLFPQRRTDLIHSCEERLLLRSARRFMSGFGFLSRRIRRRVHLATP